jgi:2-polyprenyl-3-methyl-5-hydroxy-6-metoxy-1,4-benzoquinol methylase
MGQGCPPFSFYQQQKTTDNYVYSDLLFWQPLARLGATVIGVDASVENIRIAQAHLMHDAKIAGRIKYIQATVEDLVVTEAGKFDAVVASEVVEHVADVSTFVTACCQLVKVCCCLHQCIFT